MKKNSVSDIDVTSLSEQERLKLIRAQKTDKSVLNYLKKILKNLFIEIGANCKENIFDLMNKGLLEGWCWQTTESSIVFFNNDDYIERGYLSFGFYKDFWFQNTYQKKYWHSWICFSYNNKIWVFDPCLKIIVEKELYYHIFEISEVSGIVTAKSVKEELLFRIKNNKPNFYYISKRAQQETQISGNDDVNSPMYRNNTGYTATLHNDAIKTLLAHYYYNG